jgi:hypothetical protein
MKKVLLSLAIIATLGAKAQSDTTGFAVKMVDKFKTEYVKKHFKDPYSFQLLSIKYWPVTVEANLRSKILSDSISLASYTKDSKYLQKLMKDEIEKHRISIEDSKSQLASMSDSVKSSLSHFVVIIECRGANSYGGLVYSEKVGYYYSNIDTLEIL